MIRKSTIFKLVMSLLPMVFLFAVLEINIRLSIFQNKGLREWQFRKSELYSNYLSDDDFWKLQSWIGPEFKPPESPHPLLGWVGKFDRETYLHQDTANVENRTPVLLFGDSYAACSTEKCFQDILNQSASFNKEYYLLNYGVGGYGLDQIELLCQAGVSNYQNPVIVFSFMTLDLDRSILSSRGGEKPVYSLVDGSLQLRKVAYDSFDSFLENNPLQIKSYAWNLITHSSVWPKKFSQFLTGEKKKTQTKIELNSAILEKVVADLNKRKHAYLFLVFQPDWPEMDIHIEGPDNWRDTMVKQFLQEKEIPHILTKELILKDSKETGQPVPSYFIKGDGHPTSYCNELISAEIERMILNRDYKNASTD